METELERLRGELKKRDQEIISLREQLKEQGSSCQDNDRSSSCQHGDRSSSCQHGDGSSSCQHGDGSSSSLKGDGSSSCQKNDRSSSSQHGDRSSSSQHGDRSSSSQKGDGSSSCQHGDRSSSNQHGDRSSSCQNGDGSSSSQHGDGSSSSQHGDGSSSCQHGDGSSSSQNGDGSSSSQHGDGSSSSQHGDGSSSSRNGDGSSSSRNGDGSSSCQHGDGSSSSQNDGRSSSCQHGDMPSSGKHNGGSSSCQHDDMSSSHPRLHSTDEELPALTSATLSNAEILRYSRQLVLPEFGVRGQLHLSQCSVLVIGCGGLGCPLVQYLAAAGVGRLGLLDYDEVEVSNLHRQVLHSEARIGTPKAISMASALQQLNTNVEYIPYQAMLSPANAVPLISQYDIIADCSDNVPTRYLVSDACVVAGKPLVSASALRWEGQLTVYNHQGGPCYRCLFPTPPPPETVTNCADGGVLGVIPGIMGCLQALEVLKLASGIPPSYSGTMLMFDGLEGRFRNIRLRGKRANCTICGGESKPCILKDYEEFCGSSASDKCRMLNLLTPADRMTVQEYKQLLDDGVPHLLIDVRPQVEVDICHLPHSIHIPLDQLQAVKSTDLLKEKMRGSSQCCSAKKMIAICKLGNDSQKAVKILQQLFIDGVDEFIVKDIAGGLMAWAEKIDPAFPKY